MNAPERRPQKSRTHSIFTTPSSAPMDVHRQDSESANSLVYDGECPFCSAYVKLIRLRDAVGAINLIDARQGGPLVDEMVKANIDLNQGMVLKLNGRYYHGADCINMLALLSTPSSAFNRLNAAIFRSKAMSRVLYPVLRLGRARVLRILGRSKIEPHAHQIRGRSMD